MQRAGLDTISGGHTDCLVDLSYPFLGPQMGGGGTCLVSGGCFASLQSRTINEPFLPPVALFDRRERPTAGDQRWDQRRGAFSEFQKQPVQDNGALREAADREPLVSNTPTSPIRRRNALNSSECSLDACLLSSWAPSANLDILTGFILAGQALQPREGDPVQRQSC